jgi:cupin superfamily acireductone dioxygenase involved in methionine salvage
MDPPDNFGRADSGGYILYRYPHNKSYSYAISGHMGFAPSSRAGTRVSLKISSGDYLLVPEYVGTGCLLYAVLLFLRL